MAALPIINEPTTTDAPPSDNNPKIEEIKTDSENDKSKPKSKSKSKRVTSDFKHKFLAVSNPLVVVLGIGEYDKNAFPNLIGVKRDYENVKYTLNHGRGYSMAYLTTDGKLRHFPRKCDKSQIKDKYKLYWTKNNIFDFNTKILELLNKNISKNTQNKNNDNNDNNNNNNSSGSGNDGRGAYDGLIYVISCHGGDKTIYLSNGKDLKTQEIFKVFDNENCALLSGYPKLYVIDKCRGEGLIHVEIDSEIGKNVSTYAREKREKKKLADLDDAKTDSNDIDNNNNNNTQSKPSKLKPKTSLLTLKLTINYENGIGAKSQIRRKKAINKCHKIKSICNDYYNFERNNCFVSRFTDLADDKLIHTPIKRTISKNGDSYKIFANTPGNKSVDGGTKGGYLVRSFTKVIHSDELFLDKETRFRDLVHKTRATVHSLIGDVGAQVIQDVKTTVYPIKLFENDSKYNNNNAKWKEKLEQLQNPNNNDDDEVLSTVMLSGYDPEQMSTVQSMMDVTEYVTSQLGGRRNEAQDDGDDDDDDDGDDEVYSEEASVLRRGGNADDMDNDIKNDSELTICYQNYTKYVVFANEITMTALYDQGNVELKKTVITPSTPIVFDKCTHTRFEIGKRCKSITLSECDGVDLSIAEPSTIGSHVTVKNCEFCTIYIGVLGTEEIILKDCKHITLHFASHVLQDGNAPVITSKNNENMVIKHQDLEKNEIDENISTLRLDDKSSAKCPNMDLNNIEVYKLEWSLSTIAESDYED